MLFVHDDNKSNNGQIGQVTPIGGIGKTQNFFLWIAPKTSIVTNDKLEATFNNKQTSLSKSIIWNIMYEYKSTSTSIMYTFTYVGIPYNWPITIFNLIP